MTKRCSICRAFKELDDFNRLGRTPGDRRAECRECERGVARRRYASNPEVKRERVRRYRRKNPTRQSWEGMLGRCYHPKNASYERYGGRGITVCDRWRESFENFLADMGERPEGKTLDRIDNDRGYTPANCRWATPSEQRQNQRAR